MHFKLLKSGKLWLTVAITGITFGTALLTNVTVSAAATNPAAVAMSVDSWMPDKNLQKAVSSELRSEKIITGSAFTQADLAKMTKLSINYNQPSNLSGLEYASNLSILSVADFGTNNGISDLSPLANLTQLQQLDLNHNNITDISPLAKLTDLHELHLSSNKISDISVLSGLHNLTDLEVGYNSITDLTPLSGLHLLSKLTISGNAALSNLDSLASLTNLQSLRAAYLPALTNITGIKNAVQLSYLELENDNLTDVAALQNIGSLTTVVLNSNHISDLSPLSKSFQGTIVSPKNLSAINQTVAIGSQPIDYEGKKVPVVDNSWSVQNSNFTYRFIGTTTLPNQQSISADDFTMRVGDSTPTVDDFKASATDKDGNAIKVSVDLSKADLSTPGTYDVVLTAADGQTKTVKLTVLANQQSFAGSDFTAYVGDPKPTVDDFKASATGKDGKAVDVTADLSNVDMQKAGTYNIVLTAADGRTKTVELTILANQQSLNGSDFTAYVGDPKPTVADFKASATGKDGKTVTVTADLSKVDMQKAGTYDVVLTAADGRTKTVKLTVLANQQSLNGSDFTAYVGDPKPTVDDFKASATGKDGKAVTVTADLSKVDMQKAGTYDVILTAADGQTKTVKLTVLNVLPIIYPAPEFTFTKEFVKDPTINLGTTFDPITGIYAWTDSTHSTPIPSVDWQISGNVNTNRAGAYTINYTITNAYGRTATLTRTITVAVNGPTESKTSGVVYVINNAGAVLYSDSATSISLGRTLIIATAWKYYGIVKDANGRIIAYNLGGKQYVKASDVSTSPFADRGIFTVRYPKNANWSVAVYDSHLNVLKLIPARSSWLTYGTQTLADGRTYFNLGGNQWVRTDYGYWRAQTN
ncbi:MAG: leucine-rich repeat domain-containing protein [Schleiferilactobacillus harbinensis]|uniref:leucine-rich repeat domain-containing protein n=2 Tax=Schleiferilactobacillus harbinensis TaxID=304207 RepID=UPI0039EB98C3